MGYPFGKPTRNYVHGNIIGRKDIGISGQYIFSFFCLIICPLQINAGSISTHLHSRIQLNHVAKLMGKNISEPVVSSPEFSIQIRSPKGNFIVIIKCSAISIIFVIINNYMNFFFRFVVVNIGYNLINIFTYIGKFISRLFCSIVIMKNKMFRLKSVPLQFRMVMFSQQLSR